MTDSPSGIDLFGIEELVARADARVTAAGIEAPNGQVAEALTVRNVRYYATLGLLAPPAARRGRNALYDDTHVDQLVAVKRLQGDGLQLAEIQRALVGLPPEAIRGVAAGRAEPADRFWAARAAAGAAPPDERAAARAVPEAARPLAPPAGAAAPTPAAAVTAAPYPTATVHALGEGVGLQVPTGLTLTPAAATQVLEAARAVLFAATSAPASTPPTSPTRPAPPAPPDAPTHPLIAPKAAGADLKEHRR